jgi:hypothetical protein
VLAFGHRAGAVIAAARAPQPVFSAPDPLPTIRPPQENPRHHAIIDNNHVNESKNSRCYNNGSHHTDLGCPEGPEGDAWIISQLQRIGASLALFLGGNCRIGAVLALELGLQVGTQRAAIPAGELLQALAKIAAHLQLYALRHQQRIIAVCTRTEYG